jgi:hypothetical protein
VQGSPAYFHQWVTEDRALLQILTPVRAEQAHRMHADFIETGLVHSCCKVEKITDTVALVEMLDGSVKKVPAIQIRFTDLEG